jgi:phospholipid transport system substrate-binding protein
MWSTSRSRRLIMKRWITPVTALAVVLLLCPAGWAASPTEQLRSFFAAASRILDDPDKEGKPDERLSAIHSIVRDMFDFREAAELSLGSEWSARTPAERTEFVRLFANLLERSFIVGIASRIRFADGVQVSYLGESIDGVMATVRTAITSKSGLDLPFSYRMIERGDRWAVRDVVIDGVSLAANYRAQFAHVIRISSYRDLVGQMRARVAGAPPTLLAATAIANGDPLARVTPAPAPNGAAPAEPPELASPPALPPTLLAREPALEERGAQGPQPKAVPMAYARREQAPVRPNPGAEGGSVAEEPAWLGPPPEPRIQLHQHPVAGPTRPAGARASRVRSYWVQVGAFANPDTARRLTSRLREDEPSESSQRWVVVDAPSPGSFARVRVGPFSRWGEATSKLRELEARGYKPFIAEERD